MLFCKITSKHDGHFFCLNCLNSLRTENKLNHVNGYKNYYYWYIEIPEKSLKYNHGEQSMKILFIIYADMDSMLEKIDTYHNNPEKSSATKINKHATSGYSLLLYTHCSFDATKYSHDYYGGEYCRKIFYRA